MRLTATVVLMLAVLPLVCSGISYAECKEGQIDINTATATQLQELHGIGPKKSQAIIDARPYASVSEFIKAKGIGPKTLENLKDKVCVSTEK
jgi:competence protein ComEA